MEEKLGRCRWAPRHRPVLKKWSWGVAPISSAAWPKLDRSVMDLHIFASCTNEHV
jgi:hypothetical protein